MPRNPKMGDLAELIHLATNSTDRAVDERQLKRIKLMVRSSDDNVRLASQLLMDRIAKNHSQVRYLALQIIDELFTRSKLFRSLLMERFAEFLQLTLGYRANRALPPPSDRAALLKSKALEVVERWNDMFGVHYKQVRLGYEYLKNTLRLKFPGIQEAATRAEQERHLRERRTQELLKLKLVQLSNNFDELKMDIVSTMNQLEECFVILKERGSEDDSDFEAEEELEEYGVRSLRLVRDQEEASLYESQDNTAIFDMVRDLFKLLVTRHLPATQEWLNLLMRVDPEDRERRDALLKEVIDLRNSLVSLKTKCEELGLEAVEKEEEEVEWEEQPLVSSEGLASTATETGEAASRATGAAGVDSTRELAPAVTAAASSSSSVNETRQKLLKEAPVLSWGSFLDAWGSEASVPANSRGVSLDNHWGRVDPDVLIPSEKLAALKVRASYYEPEKRDILPCLAPLRRGGLCQRRDLSKCPLHGPIVPRDGQGNPIAQEAADNDQARKGKAVAVPTPEAVAAQAVRNVRQRDEAARKQRRKSQRMEDRVHNDAVLRSASARLGSHILMEAEGTSAEAPKKRKVGGLAAMLHNKPTARDRISKRLLTGRANGAAIAQSGREEDFKYRESFPNQW